MKIEDFLKNLGAGEHLKLETYDGKNELEILRNSIGKIDIFYSFHAGSLITSGGIFDAVTLQEALNKLAKTNAALINLDWIIYKDRAELKAEIKNLKKVLHCADIC